MRLSNVCDGMNVSGCSEVHNFVPSYNWFEYFLYNYQIECGVVFGIISFSLLMFFSLKETKKDAKEEESV